MNTETVTDSFVRQLRKARDKERAIKEKAYLKSDLQHLGVPVPQIRADAKDLHRSSPDLSHDQFVELIRILWKKPIHECRVGCVELLWLYREKLRATDMTLLEKLLRESKTWALVDALAVNSTGELVERFPQLVKVLDRWASDDDFWIRRSAMLALLKPLRRGEGDFERFAGYADAMLEEKEFPSAKQSAGCCGKPPRSVPTWFTAGSSRGPDEPQA